MAREKTQQLFKFPMKGVHRTGMKNEQPEGTCYDALNVRAYDVLEDRARGGSRPGLKKWCSARGSDNRVQDLNKVVSISTSLATGSLSRRTVVPVQVTNGVIAYFDSTSVTNATVAGSVSLGNAAQTPFCFSAELFTKLYFADGYGYKVYNHANTTAYDWAANAGSLPGNTGNNQTCRLIEMWRGRIVMAGLSYDPHNWFMSKLGDAHDWDYAPAVPTEIDAVTGGQGAIGKAPDVINAIVPYTDDVLLFGCDHSIWMMSGDPQAGGRLDLVTNTVGMAFGRPYTQLPDGTLLFFSNRGSVYQMAPGTRPKSITENTIDPLITNTNLNTSFVRMAYDEKAEGVHMWISPLTTGAATHWFLDLRTPGWFKVEYGNNDFNPIAVMIFDGDDPDDREVLIGSEDGYVRTYSEAQTTDDGTNMNSYAIMGPIIGDKGRYPCILTDVQFIMDDSAANTIYEIGVGDTAEAALSDFANTFTGETTVNTTGNTTSTINIASGKSKNINPRTRGYFQYFKVGNQNTATKWAIEYIQASWSVVKSSRGRAFLSETIVFVDPDDPPLLNTSGLYAAWWAEKNVTKTGANVTAWSPYQRGAGQALRVLNNTSSNQPQFVTTDSLLNNKPSIYINNLRGFLTNTEIPSGSALDSGHGFVTFAIVANSNTTNVQMSLKDGNGTDAIRFSQVQDEGRISDTFGVGNTQTSNNDGFTQNAGIIVTYGSANPNGPWIIRINQTEILNANLGKWWDDADDGVNGLDLQVGAGGGGGTTGEWRIGAFAMYGTWNTTVLSSVENDLATRFGITF